MFEEKRFGLKMNQDVDGRIKIWKEVNRRKVDSCSRIKDENETLALVEDEVRRIMKEYSEDLYNIDTQEQITVHMYGFDGTQW